MGVGLHNKFFIYLLFLIFSTDIYAVEFKGDFKQGSFILGKTSSDTKIYIDNKNIRVSKDGYFAFGLDRDRKTDVIIKIKKNGDSKKIVKKVLKRKYKIQRIDGLPSKQVTPPPEVYERIKKDNILIGKARSTDTGFDFFTYFLKIF